MSRLGKVIDAMERRLEAVKRSLPADMEVDRLTLSVELRDELLDLRRRYDPDFLPNEDPPTVLGYRFSVDVGPEAAPFGVVCCKKRQHIDRMQLERVPCWANKWRLSDGVHVCEATFTDVQAKAMRDFMACRRECERRRIPIEDRI